MIRNATILALILTGSALAQDEPEKAPTPKEPTIKSITERLKNSQRNYTEYSRALSWSLFEACDANGDDRLNLFEASRAIPSLGGPQDAASFRALDTNKDGFVHWPEFDTRFRETIARDGIFAVKPPRPVFLVRDPSAAEEKKVDLAPHQQILELVDSDEDEAISPDELTLFLKIAGLPPQLATQHFAKLDADSSGKLTRNEFEAILSSQLPKIFGKRPKQDDKMHERLPEDLRAVDKDRNGVIDKTDVHRWVVEGLPMSHKYSSIRSLIPLQADAPVLVEGRRTRTSFHFSPFAASL